MLTLLSSTLSELLPDTTFLLPSVGGGGVAVTFTLTALLIRSFINRMEFLRPLAGPTSPLLLALDNLDLSCCTSFCAVLCARRSFFSSCSRRAMCASNWANAAASSADTVTVLVAAVAVLALARPMAAAALVAMAAAALATGDRGDFGGKGKGSSSSTTLSERSGGGGGGMATGSGCDPTAAAACGTVFVARLGELGGDICCC
mmetsp:Transcript_18142/g.28170  ORF Transcript_18142/g.28170 Transcript_18142/m.28170 type:complete len:203 (+) Transcript_18142:1114-1722(+)